MKKHSKISILARNKLESKISEAFINEIKLVMKTL